MVTPEPSNSDKKAHPWRRCPMGKHLVREHKVHAPPRPFNLQDSGDYQYWQCFPRDKLRITLEDFGYSTEDVGWEDTLSDLKIRIYVTPTIIHEYQMRRPWPVSEYLPRFKLWHKLMADQKYVCFAGSFGDKKVVIEEAIPREIYYWTFEKIKTKRGKDSYLWD